MQRKKLQLKSRNDKNPEYLKNLKSRKDKKMQ
jgi:hypothetical protein